MNGDFVHERFVGRDAELLAVGHLLQRARGGRPRPLLLTGPSGSGKSMLLRRIAADATAAGFRVLQVRGELAAGDRPLGALHQAVRAWADDEPLTTEVAATLLDALETARPGDARRFLTVVDATRHLLEATAFRTPVLVAVDDVHLLDDETASLAVLLTRHIRRHRVMVVVTGRAEPDVGTGWLDDMWRTHDAGHLDVFELGPFDDDDLAALVVAHLGRQPDEAFVSELHVRTGGLPFFAAELVGALGATGVAELPDGRVTMSAQERPLPRRVATAVLHRVFQLGADARRLAAAASVFGPVPIERLGLLATLTGLTLDQADDAFDRLVRARVLVADGSTYRFVHLIVRDALRSDAGPAAARALHGAIARALVAGREAGDDTDIAEIARHVRLGPSARDPVAAGLLRDAGDAVADSAPGTAAEWYRDTLGRLAPDDPAVVDTQLRLSRALVRSDRHRDAERIATAVLGTAHTSGQRIRAAVIAAHAAVAAGRADRAGALLDAAVEEGTDASARVVLHRALVHTWSGQPIAAERCVGEAIALGAAVDDPMLLSVRMTLRADTGDIAEAERLAGVLRRLDDRALAGSHPERRLALCLLGAQHLDPALVVEEAAGPAICGPLATWFRAASAWARLRLGDLEGAVEAAVGARDAAEPEPKDLLTHVLAPVLVIAHAERGELERALDAARWAAGEPGALLAVATARLSSLAGDHRRAAAVLLDAERRASTGVGPLAMVLAERVEAAAVAGDVAAARAANERLQSLPRDRAAVAMGMWCLLADATARRDPVAARSAREHAIAHGLGLDAARAAALAGELDHDSGMLTTAHDELARLGAVTRQRHVARRLRTLGHGAPTVRGSTGSQLSAVEAEVSDHVAHGLTNRQVADRMHLSPKTIEVYLSRIYAKTGCRSRVELAVAVHSGTLRTTA